MVAATLATLAGATSQSQAQSVGSVRLHIVKVGFILGVAGGNGVLHYHGHTYRLNIGGINAGTIGISGVTFVGTASNLHHPADIAGTYGQGAAGAAIVAGANVANLKNEKGVVLHVSGPQIGFDATLGLGGMIITLAR